MIFTFYVSQDYAYNQQYDDEITADSDDYKENHGDYYYGYYDDDDDDDGKDEQCGEGLELDPYCN